MLGLKLMLTAGILWWVVWYIANDYKSHYPFIWERDDGATLPLKFAFVGMGIVTIILAVIAIWVDIPC